MLDQTFAQAQHTSESRASPQILQCDGVDEILVGFIHSFRRRATDGSDSEIRQSLSRYVDESINLGKSSFFRSFIHLLSQAQESLQII